MDSGALGAFNTKEKVAEAIDVLLSSGVTTIDTARIYPGSEVALGKQEKRTQFTIDTKVPGGFAPNTARKDTIIEHAKEALEKVNIKQFDILYIHSPDPDIPLEDTLAGITLWPGLTMRGGLPNPANIPTTNTCHPLDGICRFPDPWRDPIGTVQGIVGYFTGAHKYN